MFPEALALVVGAMFLGRYYKGTANTLYSLLSLVAGDNVITRQGITGSVETGDFNRPELTHAAARVLRKNYVDQLGDANPKLANRSRYEIPHSYYKLPERSYFGLWNNPTYHMHDAEFSNPRIFTQYNENEQYVNGGPNNSGLRFYKENVLKAAEDRNYQMFMEEPSTPLMYDYVQVDYTFKGDTILKGTPDNYKFSPRENGIPEELIRPVF